MISEGENAELWGHCYGLLGEGIESSVENGRLEIVLAGVTCQTGETRVGVLGSDAKIYVQLSGDWDADDLKALILSSSANEALPTPVRPLQYPEGIDSFVELPSSAVSSPIALYDMASEASGSALGEADQGEGSSRNAPDDSDSLDRAPSSAPAATGGANQVVAIALLAIAIFSGIVAALLFRKNNPKAKQLE